jgi:hypothetical protein
VNNLRKYPKHCSRQLALALQVDDLDVRGACHQRFNNTLFFIWLLQRETSESQLQGKD